ncbi:uncharacterized protein IWZ02DRAFT_114997 [Phyllosticta citriasiana]|uniref:uncharacterized protein n=1 Tax=Phyllosticta citriasiana TaxID=595635 RepID=UPI0030FDAB3F
MRSGTCAPSTSWMKPAPGLSSGSTLHSACDGCARPARFDRSVHSWMRWKRLCQVEGSDVRIKCLCSCTFSSLSLFLVLPFRLRHRLIHNCMRVRCHIQTHQLGTLRLFQRLPQLVQEIPVRGAVVQHAEVRLSRVERREDEPTDGRDDERVLGTQTRGFGCGGEQGEVEGRGGFALVVAVVLVLVVDMFVVSLRNGSVEGGRKGGSGEVGV